MEKKVFLTETDVGYLRKVKLSAHGVVLGVFTCIAALGLTVTWQFFVFLECLILIGGCVSFFAKKYSKEDCEFRFEGDVLLIRNRVNGEVYEVKNTPACDFILNQSEKEKAKDLCTLTIRRTILVYGGVKHCSQLRQYIEENFN